MEPGAIAITVVVAIFLILMIGSRFLTSVEAGTIRLVSWYGGRTAIYKGPGKAWEVPLLTTGTSIPSRAINIDLDIADQTADLDPRGVPEPMKVRVLARDRVDRRYGRDDPDGGEQVLQQERGRAAHALTDLLTSAGRRAVNLLKHDELFSAKSPVQAPGEGVAIGADEDDDRLAIIIKKNCSRSCTTWV